MASYMPTSEMVRLYESGESLNKISRCGISTVAVRERLLRAGVTMRGVGPMRGVPRRRSTPEDRAEARRLYSKGLSTYEVGRRLGWNHNTIQRWVATRSQEIGCNMAEDDRNVRARRGIRRGARAKLTEAQALRIRIQRIGRPRPTLRELAERYGVSRSAIGSAARGETWGTA